MLQSVQHSENELIDHCGYYLTIISAQLLKTMPYCPRCGKQVDESASFCPECGTNLPHNAQSGNVPPAGGNTVIGENLNERWLITFLLCFFLGCLGIHRFYTNRTATGVAMLLTLGGCGIWALVDFIMILCNTYTDGNGQKLKA
ncbi:MAG: NINE protein [Candidatus Cryptobacteroides sp.]